MFVSFPKIYRLDNHPIFERPENLENRERTLYGSVKLHGTNAGIGVTKDNQIWCQGRNRELTVDSDNYNFAEYCSQQAVQHWAIQQRNRLGIPKHLDFIVFGEWAGEKIQSKVAISKVPRFFAPFAWATINGEKIEQMQLVEDFESDEALRIFPTKVQFKATINLADAKSLEVFEDFASQKVQEIEDCDPFAKENFDVQGIGEGIVWYVSTERGMQPFCKSKGEKHQKSRQEKMLSQEHIAKMQAKEKALEWLKSHTTGRRIEQAFEYFDEMQIEANEKNALHFVKWIANDICTEEKVEMLRLGIEEKDVKSVAGKHLYQLYFKEIKQRKHREGV